MSVGWRLDHTILARSLNACVVKTKALVFLSFRLGEKSVLCNGVGINYVMPSLSA